MICSANASSSFLRRAGASFAQPPCSNARRALATAASTSACSQEATCASTRPSIGLTHSNVAPLAAGT
jgi:hypothetical protein